MSTTVRLTDLMMRRRLFLEMKSRLIIEDQHTLTTSHAVCDRGDEP